MSGDDLSGLELLCMHSAGAEPHYFGASSAFSFTKLFSATLRGVRAQGPGLTMAGISNNASKSRPKPAPAPFPDEAILTRLTTAYFDQVHPQFPFLHRPTYLKWESDVLACRRNGEPPDQAQLFFVYAIAAIGTLAMPAATDLKAEVRPTICDNLVLVTYVDIFISQGPLCFCGSIIRGGDAAEYATVNPSHPMLRYVLHEITHGCINMVKPSVYISCGGARRLIRL